MAGEQFCMRAIERNYFTNITYNMWIFSSAKSGESGKSFLCSRATIKNYAPFSRHKNTSFLPTLAFRSFFGAQKHSQTTCYQEKNKNETKKIMKNRYASKDFFYIHKNLFKRRGRNIITNTMKKAHRQEEAKLLY